MANSIALAEEYTNLLDSKYQLDSLTAGLEINDAFVRGFDNAGTVQVLSMVLQGLATYSRATGFVAGDITATWVAYQITNDRGRSFSVDAMDDQEANSMIFANLAKEFMEQHVIPEVDAIRFAKMATDGTTPVEAALATGNDYLTAIDAAVLAMDEAKVPQAQRVLYISATGFSLLKNADKVTRNVNVETSDGAVNRAIWSLDGIPLYSVPSSLFNTEITLAASGAGGFTATGVAINFQLISKPAVNAITRHAKVRLFPADVNQDADADKFQYRIYHDLLVYGNKTEGVYTHSVVVI